MLYTFSQAHYSETELQRYLTEITENDAVVLWQDGVLLAVKYGEMFIQCKGQCFMLEQDVLARNLTALLPENNQVRSVLKLMRWLLRDNSHNGEMLPKV